MPLQQPAHPSLRRRFAVGLLALAFAAGCTSPTDTVPAFAVQAGFEGASLGDWRYLPPDTVEIHLRADTGASTGFWFDFEVEGAQGQELVFRVDDALSLYGADAWEGRQPVTSADGGATWTRITRAGREGGRFTFHHRFTAARERIAVALPYGFSRWLERVEALRGHPSVRSVEVVGESLEGRPVHLLEIGDPAAGTPPSQVWALARQHPGEPEGSHMLEGFLDWVLSDDPDAMRLRSRARILVVPFMNPDGVVRGNQRVNLAGLDLNRQWAAPDARTSPTVLAARSRMLREREGGAEIRIVLDFHGAPPTRANFFYRNDAASLPAPLHDEMSAFLSAVAGSEPGFVLEPPTAERPVGAGERARGFAWVDLSAHGLTVEASAMDVTYGPWAGSQMTEDRYRALGASVARAVATVLYAD